MPDACCALLQSTSFSSPAVSCPRSDGELHVLSPAPCSQDDLDAIKLLKRELAVAIREEDYSTAARIRDHPFMRMYREMWMNRCVVSSARHVSACIGALLPSVGEINSCSRLLTRVPPAPHPAGCWATRLLPSVWRVS